MDKQPTYSIEVLEKTLAEATSDEVSKILSIVASERRLYTYDQLSEALGLFREKMNRMVGRIKKNKEK